MHVARGGWDKSIENCRAVSRWGRRFENVGRAFGATGAGMIQLGTFIPGCLVGGDCAGHQRLVPYQGGGGKCKKNLATRNKGI